jgi:hypothetical protein
MYDKPASLQFIWFLSNAAGLPDGIYIIWQKYQFGYILEGLVRGNIGNLEYFVAIFYSKRALCVLSFGIFPPFWYVLSTKIWQPRNTLVRRSAICRSAISKSAWGGSASAGSVVNLREPNEDVPTTPGWGTSGPVT